MIFLKNKNNSYFNFNKLIFLPVLFCLSCNNIEIQPQWQKTFSSSSDHYDTLSFVDSVTDSEDLYFVGHSQELSSINDTMVVMRLTPEGNVIWKKSYDIDSYDRPWAHAIDNQQNLYVASENYVIKFSAQGDLLWSVQLKDFSPPPTEQDPDPSLLIRDMKIINDQIYLAGKYLTILNPQGQIIQHVKFEKPIWQIQYQNKILYTAGNGLIQAFEDNNLNQPLIHYQLSQPQNPPAAMAIDQAGRIFVVTRNDSPQDSAYLTALSANGKLLWSKFYDDVDNNSYYLPGTPKLHLLNNNKLVLTLSQQPTRWIQWVSINNGRTINQYKTKAGIVQDMKKNESDFTVVTGEKQSQLFNGDGDLLATSYLQQDVEITSGSIAVKNNKIYIGNSVFINGSATMMLSKFQTPQ